MTITSTPLQNFKALTARLRGLIDTIEAEVIKQIDLRNPNQVISPQAVQSSETLVAAARKYEQLSDELASYAVGPSDHVTTLAGGFHESNALQVASELHIADTLGNEEIPLTVLASKVGADVVRLRQCMRLLVNRRVFRETSFGSDVFANNRMSSVLLSSYEHNVNGYISHCCEDSYRAGVSIVPSIRAATANKPAFDIQYGQSIWEYFLTPEGADARERLNRTMLAAEPSGLYGYDWTKFGDQFTLIDVGGGVGGAMLEFVRKFPNLKVVLQDRPSVIEAAPKFWDGHAPECKSRVTFMGHDFFTPQPKIETTGFRFYFIRLVLHDWQDDDCVRILEQIAAAMKEYPNSRLCIVNTVINADSDRFNYILSMHAMTLAGAFERNEDQFREITGRAGLKVEGIWRNAGHTAVVECTV